MTLIVSTLRPGLLVGLKTSIEGNVDIVRTELVEDHLEADGSRVARWETERTVLDAAEHETAVKVRSKARGLLTGICARSDFGLLCPEDKKPQLEAAVREARRLCDEFNIGARLTEIKFFVVTGRIAVDDVEAIRAINNEVRGLIDEMQQGITKLDVEAVRAAASKAKQLGSMLSPDAQARIQGAIDAVRGEAKKMIKAGEQAATEIDVTVLAKLAEARTAFLDLDAAGEVIQPDAATRAIDLDPEVDAMLGEEPAPRDLDLDDMLG